MSEAQGRIPSIVLRLLMTAGLAFAAPATRVNAEPESPLVGEVSKSPERLTRCGYRTRQTVDGRDDREAVCVFENAAGSLFLVSVRVFCDEGCRPVGTPVLTEFYE